MASQATITAQLMLASMIAAVRSKFGLGMKTERAVKLAGHISPADYYGRGGHAHRRKKTNRLHLSRKAKVMKRRAVAAR